MKGLRLLGLVCVTVVLVAGCGDDQVSNPTPAPAPTPAPTPNPTPTPTPPAAPAALDSLAVSPGSVEGQASPTATVTLTENAPAGGAAIVLQSGNNDVAKVPASVTVPAGQKTVTFTVDTSTVSASTQVTLQGTYLGVTKLFVLTVTAPALTPRFTVTSNSKGSNACSIVDANGVTDCVFNASTSGGFVATYIWTLKVGNTSSTFSGGKDTAGAFTPSTACANLQGGSLDGNESVQMTVSLVLEDRAGVKSTSAESRQVSLYPLHNCGY